LESSLYCPHLFLNIKVTFHYVGLVSQKLRDPVIQSLGFQQVPVKWLKRPVVIYFNDLD